jgi:hypothetical protein
MTPLERMFSTPIAMENSAVMPVFITFVRLLFCGQLIDRRACTSAECRLESSECSVS